MPREAEKGIKNPLGDFVLLDIIFRSHGIAEKQSGGKLTEGRLCKCRDGGCLHSTTSIQQLNPSQRRQVPTADGQIYP